MANIRRRLTIIFADRMKHVERLHGLVAGDRAVDDAAGNPPHFTRLKRPCLALDRKRQLAFQQHSHLLVRMTVRLHDRARLKVHKREHHLVSRRREDVNAGKDFVTRAVEAGNKVVHFDLRFGDWGLDASIRTIHKSQSYGSSAIRKSRLYFANRSLRAMEPILMYSAA